MRLTRQTGHAIRILIDCAHAGNGLVKVADIANRLDLTKQNVFKIVHILSRAGFVAAVRGPSGGVRLAAPAHNIRVGDVVRAIEVTDVRVGGSEDDDSIGIDGAHVNTMLDDALGAFIAVLDQHTLADLAASAATADEAGSAPAPKPNRRRASAPVGAPRKVTRRG